MIPTDTSFWPSNWLDPSWERTDKPRTQGITMVIDKGLGIRAFDDLLATAASYIDVYKLGFGTCVLYPLDILQQKISMARENGIKIMPGGTFFEVAHTQSPLETYFARLKALGFNAIEISDGTLPISKEERLRAISLAAEAGFHVFSEYGKKASDFSADKELLLETLHEDIDAGSEYVIVEARESGNVGIYNKQGQVDDTFLLEVTREAGELASRLIWEAPQKEQQVAMLNTLGYSTNLGNIAPADLISLEALRRGLRGDTAALIILDRGKSTCE
ncbi:phosphosulfolactate synthase [Brevibacillus dissolubilis]|uniref:phosphosulfolactate synthase n=1 Tax=Brevibacillus dissolubilis TaxID=1844116 RepID=UPI0011168BE5|nr:phosphosulfolactate synthase [Brevibacillus dissolubilis]